MVRRTNQANQAKPNKSTSDLPKLTFLEHLYELRKRLFWIILTLVFTTAVGLEIKDQLIEVIMAPLKGGKLVYLNPGGGFSFIFTLSLYFGILLTIPVITYQIYRFLQPMLQETSRKFVMIFITVSCLLAGLGAALAYLLAIPGALGFLDGVAGSSIVPNLTADSYLSFVTTYIVGLAALFQLPLLLFLYDHVKPIPPGTLVRSQRYGIVGTTIMAGFITPSPDLLNYSIVLFPILAAYEFGVLAVYLRRKLVRNKAKVPAPVSKVIQAESIIEEEPLTAIIEEMAVGNAQHIGGEIQQEPAFIEAPQPVPQNAPAPSEYADALEQYVSTQYAAHSQPVPTQQAVDDIKPSTQAVVSYQQVAAQLTPHASRGRSIDGIRVANRYKTNVHVPPRRTVMSPAVPHQQNSDQSGENLLTAQA